MKKNDFFITVGEYTRPKGGNISCLEIWVGNVAPDKVKHFAGSALMAFVLFAFFGLYGAATALFIGVLKEVYDALKPRPTGFNFADLLADALGVVAGSAVAFGVQVAPLIVKIIMTWITIN